MAGGAPSVDAAPMDCGQLLLRATAGAGSTVTAVVATYVAVNHVVTVDDGLELLWVFPLTAIATAVVAFALSPRHGLRDPMTSASTIAVSATLCWGVLGLLFGLADGDEAFHPLGYAAGGAAFGGTAAATGAAVGGAIGAATHAIRRRLS